MFVSVQDITCARLACEMRDVAVDEEVPTLFADFTKIGMFDPSKATTLHAIPQFCFKYCVPQSFWTVPRAPENARRQT